MMMKKITVVVVLYLVLSVVYCEDSFMQQNEHELFRKAGKRM